MSVSVSRSLANVEQGRSTWLSVALCLSSFFASQRVSLDRLRRARTINLIVSRSLSVQLFCFAVCVCHVCLFRFLARSLTSSKDDRPAMSIAISPSSFFASQRVPVTAPDRREFCRSLANSLAKSIKNHGENRSKIDPGRHLGAPKID